MKSREKKAGSPQSAVGSKHSALQGTMKPVVYRGTIWFTYLKPVGELHEGALFRTPTNRRSTYTVTGVDHRSGYIIAKNSRGDIHRFNETYPVIYLSPTIII